MYSCWLNALIVLGKLKLNQVLVLSLNAHIVRLISRLNQFHQLRSITAITTGDSPWRKSTLNFAWIISHKSMVKCRKSD